MTTFSMPDNSDTNSQNSMSAQNSTSAAGFKSRRKTSMFFKKSVRQDESTKDETIKRLEEEKRKLKQELNKAYSRIRELELLTTRPSPEMPLQESQSTSELVSTSESVENRDDDDNEDIKEFDDESTSFSVEVAAITRGSTVQGEFLDIENEIYSTAPSAATIPTGNNKKSNLQRRQDQLRLKLRRGSSSISSRSGSSSSRSKSSRSSRSKSRSGQDAHLDYFSRRNSPPLEKITEIETRLNYFDDEDSNSMTSELTASVASSAMLADERRKSGSSSHMAGSKIPLPDMTSLLRTSSESIATEAESDAFSYIYDNESGLYGEI